MTLPSLLLLFFLLGLLDMLALGACVDAPYTSYWVKAGDEYAQKLLKSLTPEQRQDALEYGSYFVYPPYDPAVTTHESHHQLLPRLRSVNQKSRARIILNAGIPNDPKQTKYVPLEATVYDDELQITWHPRSKRKRSDLCIKWNNIIQIYPYGEIDSHTHKFHVDTEGKPVHGICIQYWDDELGYGEIWIIETGPIDHGATSLVQGTKVMDHLSIENPNLRALSVLQHRATEAWKKAEREGQEKRQEQLKTLQEEEEGDEEERAKRMQEEKSKEAQIKRVEVVRVEDKKELREEKVDKRLKPDNPREVAIKGREKVREGDYTVEKSQGMNKWKLDDEQDKHRVHNVVHKAKEQMAGGGKMTQDQKRGFKVGKKDSSKRLMVREKKRRVSTKRSKTSQRRQRGKVYRKWQNNRGKDGRKLNGPTKKQVEARKKIGKDEIELKRSRERLEKKKVARVEQGTEREMKQLERGIKEDQIIKVGQMNKYQREASDPLVYRYEGLRHVFKTQRFGNSSYKALGNNEDDDDDDDEEEEEREDRDINRHLIRHRRTLSDSLIEDSRYRNYKMALSSPKQENINSNINGQEAEEIDSGDEDQEEANSKDSDGDLVVLISGA